MRYREDIVNYEPKAGDVQSFDSVCLTGTKCKATDHELHRKLHLQLGHSYKSIGDWFTARELKESFLANAKLR